MTNLILSTCYFCKTKTFSAKLELERIREQQKVNKLEFKTKFIDLGVVEKTAEGYILSHNYYKTTGKPGVHTRLIGLSRDKKKELIIAHIKKNKKGYMKDFMDAFPELKTMDVSNLLRELRKDGKIRFEGASTPGFWVLM